jgi:cullin 3
VKACKSFERFYLSQYTGRTLTWLPSFGNADVKVTFKTHKHILNLSSFALIILLLFENLGTGESLTYAEIKNATEIPDRELQRNLYSLACAKFKVLRKHPFGRNVNPDDSFSFNEGFSSPLRKIKINTAGAWIESDEEQMGTQRGVKEERRYQTDVRT